MPSEIGSLSEQIWVQERTVANSTLGAPVETWVLHMRAYAQVMSKPGQERYREERELNVTSRDLRIRFNSKADELTQAGGSGKFRVLYPSTSAEPWDLQDAVRVDGRRRWVDLKIRRVF